MLLVLILLPLFVAALIPFTPNNRSRVACLITVALFHLGWVISFWKFAPEVQAQGFLSLDVLGLLVLSIVSVLFAMVSLYLIGYLKPEGEGSNRMFISCLLIFLSAMTLVTVSRHMGLLWIALEATTLFAATLINFHRSQRGIEATWKCLLICSVGIALALLGTFFLAVAGNNIQTLLLEDLFQHASLLSASWLKLSVVFLLVGYGTKMGLAPMHSWKPDAYGEAPGPVGALMSGALTSCAFLAILRVGQLCYQAHQMPFFQSILLLLGLVSLFIAAIFILGQTDFNRMLGYSSIEHMGILVLGIGLGGMGFYGSIFHMLNNAFAKGLIFLVAGSLYRRYKTKNVKDIQGVLFSSPVLGVFLLIGLLAVTGFPPFGTFTSELMILNAAVVGKHYVVAFFYVLFLAIIFIGMSRIILNMAQGRPREESTTSVAKEEISMVIPLIVLGGIIFSLGVYMPSFLEEALQRASVLLGG